MKTLDFLTETKIEKIRALSDQRKIIITAIEDARQYNNENHVPLWELDLLLIDAQLNAILNQ